jgi:succinate-semialdehyde dehydrogenase/glutarate-semialdehyde dehydrogenase
MSNSAEAPKANNVLRPDLKLPPLGNFIGGQWRSGDRRFKVLDKYTQETIAEPYHASTSDVGDAIAAAERAFARGLVPPVERARFLRKAADLIDSNRQRLIDIMVAETGFTPSDSEGDLNRTIVTLSLCAEEATRIVGETVAFAATPGQHDRIGFTIRVPLGVVCAITPFNSPLNTVAHKIAPALAAGNPVVLKPSNLTPLTAALLCEILIEAGVAEGYLSLVQGSGSIIGAQLVADQRIAFYSFTGSTEVGRVIQQGAGLRRTQMELGSIASTIICADADIARAIPRVANAGFRKAGQVCTSVQRLYVEASAFDDVVAQLVKAAEGMKAGDPRAPETRVGPMITEKEAQRAEAWIAEAGQSQARILCGGTRVGAVLAPTVVTNVQPGMKVVDQEIFAPCIVALPFEDLSKAVQHANNTPYGLSSGIFTRDVNRALDAARTLRFGAIHINETSSSRADGMPFGGVKDSGFGHEGPKYAMRELTEERLITLNR